jgi:hypothetical protein
MNLHFSTLAWVCICLVASVCIHAQQGAAPSSIPKVASAVEEDPAVILEIGAATNWNFSGGAATFAPNLAAEVTPIENWLELEAGVSPFYTRNSSEWDADFLFKKPWTLSRTAEFMFGVGPQWSHTHQNNGTSDTLSAEAAGDFMFWPTGRHCFGWFLEPAYNYSFAGGHTQSIGISAGLLIGLHRQQLR